MACHWYGLRASDMGIGFQRVGHIGNLFIVCGDHKEQNVIIGFFMISF